MVATDLTETFNFIIFNLQHWLVKDSPNKKKPKLHVKKWQFGITNLDNFRTYFYNAILNLQKVYKMYKNLNYTMINSNIQINQNKIFFGSRQTAYNYKFMRYMYSWTYMQRVVFEISHQEKGCIAIIQVEKKASHLMHIVFSFQNTSNWTY